MTYRIKQVSDLSGVSIRMLRYFDRIGLLVPDNRQDNGYRCYSENDIDRLFRIVFLRELDFSLEETKILMDASEEDLGYALRRQLDLLDQRIERLVRIKKTVEKEIDGMKSKDNERFLGFDMKEIEENKRKYTEETKEKYGNTKAYRQSMERTSAYDSSDWKRITEEAERIYDKLSALMDLEPDDEKVLEAIGEWRKHIDVNYYECTDEIFLGLADMYVSDGRFKENIDKHGKGLADFMSRAMKASIV